MSRWFIGKTQVQIVEIALALDFNFIFLEYFFQPTELALINGFIYNYNGIIDIASFDQVVLQEHFQLVQKAKSAAGGNLCFEISDLF